HAFWVENQNLKKQKRRRKKHKKKVSSVKFGRNKDEGTLSEEHNVQEEDTVTSFLKRLLQRLYSNGLRKGKGDVEGKRSKKTLKEKKSYNF
ncbi:hypothetical protein Tco_0470140, partial [Tanacetum coccineum]